MGTESVQLSPPECPENSVFAELSCGLGPGGCSARVESVLSEKDLPGIPALLPLVFPPIVQTGTGGFQGRKRLKVTPVVSIGATITTVFSLLKPPFSSLGHQSF